MGPLRFRPGPGPRLLSGPGLTDGAGLVVQALRCQCDPGPLTSGSQKVWTLPSLPSPKGTPRASGLLGEPRRVWKSPQRPFCPGPALPESAGSLCAAGPTEESPVPAWVAGLGTASQERPTPPPPRHLASVLEGAVRLPSVGIQSDEQGLSTSDRRTETQETRHTGDGRTAWRPRGAQKGPAAARHGLPSGAGRRSSESRVPRRSWDRGAPPCGS